MFTKKNYYTRLIRFGSSFDIKVNNDVLLPTFKVGYHKHNICSAIRGPRILGDVSPTGREHLDLDLVTTGAGHGARNQPVGPTAKTRLWTLRITPY